MLHIMHQVIMNPNSGQSRQYNLNGGNVGGRSQAGIADMDRKKHRISQKQVSCQGLSLLLLKDPMKQLVRPQEDYFKLVNQGVSIVDYFGHGALASLEYPNNYLPSKYSNSPRLPILIIKGCKTGNCQRDGSSIPAKFLYEDNVGIQDSSSHWQYF